jgi:hypothetical protein
MGGVGSFSQLKSPAVLEFTRMAGCFARTLTTGVDNIVGTAGSDTFVADNTNGVTGEVTSSADSVDGGLGTDTFKIYSDGTIGGLPALTSIENVNIYDEDTDLSLSSSTWTSVTAVNLIRNDGDMKLTVGVNVATVNLSDIGLNDAGANDGMTIALDSTATAVTLGLDKITVGTDTSAETVTLTGSALTNVTVNTTGTASTFDTLDVAGATTITINAGVALTTALSTTGTAVLNISGAGAVNLGTLDTSIDNISATANTGGVTATIGAAVVDTVFTGSAGNDVITASGADTLLTTDTLSVNAGAGTGDILIVGDASDIDTAADAARYTNFEILRLGDTQNVSLISGITAIQLSGATSKTYSGLTATQAANVTVRADETTPVFTLGTATGTADVLTLKMGTASTTAAATDIVTGVTVTGFETVNIVENGGPTATVGADRTTIIAAFTTPTTLSAVNMTGRAVSITNAATTVAATFDASNLTGDGTVAGSKGLTIASTTFIAGSVVNGSNFIDTITIAPGTEGVTLNLGAGNDLVTADVATLVADGTTDGAINGGQGTDKLTVSTTGATTMTDNHFTKLSGLEQLVLTNTTGDASITTGTAFNMAFADGATITTGTKATASSAAINAGLATVPVSYTLDATDMVGLTGGKDITVTTGSAADTVVINGDATWVGATAGDGSSIIISTGAGVDNITVTVGTLISQTTSQAISITAGTGADLITKTTSSINGTTAEATATFVIASGDSTVAAYDKITGFDVGVTTGTRVADSLNFDSSAIGTLATTVDYGLIMSHNISGGVVTFDDVASYSVALVINSTNLADVIGYLAANTATNDVVAFAYDSDASGTADATMVYSNETTDSLVMLVGVTGVDLLSLTTTSATNGDIVII